MNSENQRNIKFIYELFQPYCALLDRPRQKKQKNVDLSFIQAIARGRVEGYRILLRLALIFDSQQFV